MPQRREYHFQSFSTDGLGFRNPPNFLQSNCPSALLVGSSFSIGASVTDEQTLSVRLSQLSGRGIYNAGGLEPASANSIRALAQRLNMRGGVVIYEFLERNNIPKPVREHPIAQGPIDLFAWPAMAATKAHWQAIKPSRLRILAQQNDWALPNYSPFVAAKPLRNGDAMLFLRDHLKIKAERDVSTAATYFSWLADELGKDNLSLLVALVPEKITVYRPLLLEGASAAAAEKGYLDRVEEVLREQGIPVVNLAPVFRREAQIKFQRGEYIYHLDDTHWNARGISIAANEILAVWNRRIAAAQAR